jgi:hypothetical protein
VPLTASPVAPPPAGTAKTLPSYGITQIGWSVAGGDPISTAAATVIVAWTNAAGTPAAFAWCRVSARRNTEVAGRCVRIYVRVSPSPGEEAVDEEIDEQLEPLVGVALGIGAGDRNEVGEPCPPVTTRSTRSPRAGSRRRVDGPLLAPPPA